MILGIFEGLGAGLLAGSFIATLVTRYPRGESALAGRSRCDSCGAQIAIASLVPVLSYALQRGRARCCGSRIDRLHPMVEIAAALIGGLSALLTWPQSIACAWFGWLLLTLGLIDLRVLRLPDTIVALLGISGIAASVVLGSATPLESIVGAILGFLSLEAVRFAYHRLRGREGIGRGDPKMFAAIGAWIGWSQLPLALLIAALVGLVWAALVRLSGTQIEWSDRLPLGTLLALAAWPVWLWNFAALAR